MRVNESTFSLRCPPNSTNEVLKRLLNVKSRILKPNNNTWLTRCYVHWKWPNFESRGRIPLGAKRPMKGCIDCKSWRPSRSRLVAVKSKMCETAVEVFHQTKVKKWVGKVLPIKMSIDTKHLTKYNSTDWNKVLWKTTSCASPRTWACRADDCGNVAIFCVRDSGRVRRK